MNTKFKTTRWFPLVTAIGTVLLALVPLESQAAKADQAELNIQRVALFKNGLGFFTSSATLPEGKTTVELGQFPVASQGTFWIGYPQDVKVRWLVTSMKDVNYSLPIRNVAELLQANPGRQVTLFTKSKERSNVIGTIEKISTQYLPPVPNPYRMAPRPPESMRHFSPHYGNPPVLIRTKHGIVALDLTSIERVEFTENDLCTTTSTTIKQPSLRLELEKAAGGKEIGIHYLCRGITWSPSYLIDLSDPEMARLSAKAVVINEVADLENVQLELVTGFPQARLAEVASPVAMSQNLEGFLKALTSGRSESRGNAFLMQQRASADPFGSMGLAGQYPADAPQAGYSTARKGATAEDLFLYPVKRFSLAQGQTACVPLFTIEAPYKHIYTWNIPDLINQENPVPRNPQEKRSSTDEVWHCCRLENNMEMPWTTAAAEFVTDGQFVGQDVCYYTAPGSETTVRINRAMNIRAEQAEFELRRERNAKIYYGYNHDLVTVRGELALENFSKDSIELEVTKHLSGEVFESKPEAEDIPTAKSLKAVNPRHKLIWKVQMKPGEKQKLSYQFKVYVRR